MSIKSTVTWLGSSIWLFPGLIILLLVVLTVLRIHGSSIGMYHTLLNGPGVENPDIIYGVPRAIRSDEWRIWTPTTILQEKTDFASFNEKLGSGRELSFKPEAPTKNWVTLFRPHNWSFFVLPFENAFTLRWWLGPAALSIGVYFFVLRFLKKRMLASILSICFTLSPFLLWWHQSALFISLASAIFALIISIRIIEGEKISPLEGKRIPSELLYVLALIFLGGVFGLLIYVPFLVPIALCSVAFLVGYILQRWLSDKKITTHQLSRRLLYFLPVLVVVAVIGLAFYIDNRELIEIIGNSEYPGQRRIVAKGLTLPALLPLVGTFLQPLLQKTVLALNYATNQSEGSSFVVPLLFLIIPAVILQAYDYVKNKRINYILTCLHLLTFIFLAKIFLPFGNVFYKLILLDRVPHNRLLVGFGLIGLIHLVFFIKYIAHLDLPKRAWSAFTYLYSLLCLVALVRLAVAVNENFPGFIPGLYFAVGLAVLFVLIIFFFTKNKPVLGSLALFVFAVGSSFAIMPLHVGLDSIEDSRIVRAMEQVSDPDDYWVVLDNLDFQNLPLIAGRGSIGGVQVYTDEKFWGQIDDGNKDKYIYNRQANALFLSNTAPVNDDAKYNVTSIDSDIELVKLNLFKIKFTCSNFTYENIDNVLITRPFDISCLELRKKVDYPKFTFYLYDVVRP